MNNKHIKNTPRLTYLIVAITITLAPYSTANLAYAQDSEGNTEQSSETLNLPAIYVIKAKQDLVIESVLLTGLIEPVEEVYVQPQIEGQPIDSLNVNVSDTVEKGQTLATLSTHALQLQKNQLLASEKNSEARIAQARAQISDAAAASSEAERVSQRTETLSQRGVVSKAEKDATTAAAQSATARLSAAKQAQLSAQAQSENVIAQIADIDYRLERAAIKAPIAGTIISRNARLGAIATAAGNPMFVIMRDGALELRVDVSEGDLLKLQPGQKANIRVAGHTDPVIGTVHLIEPSIDRTSRLGRARISIDDTTTVRNGMFAEAQVEIKRALAVVLPLSAVDISSASSTALVVKDNEVHKVKVKTGAQVEGQVEILDGIQVDDIVVVRAGAYIRDGDKIHPVLLEDPVDAVE